MTAIYSAIRAGLTNHLAATSNIPPIVDENTQFNPQVGTTYVRTYLNPGEPYDVELGIDGSKMFVGIFQANILSPSNSDLAPIEALVDAIVSQFSRATAIQQNGINIRIKSVTRRAALVDTVWYQVPVTISWWTLIKN